MNEGRSGRSLRSTSYWPASHPPRRWINDKLILMIRDRTRPRPTHRRRARARFDRGPAPSWYEVRRTLQAVNAADQRYDGSVRPQILDARSEKDMFVIDWAAGPPWTLPATPTRA